MAQVRDMAEEDLIMLHLGFGERIRNQCGLWENNKELLRSYGSENMHPCDASMVVIEETWRCLQIMH